MGRGLVGGEGAEAAERGVTESAGVGSVVGNVAVWATVGCCCAGVLTGVLVGVANKCLPSPAFGRGISKPVVGVGVGNVGKVSAAVFAEPAEVSLDVGKEVVDAVGAAVG